MRQKILELVRLQRNQISQCTTNYPSKPPKQLSKKPRNLRDHLATKLFGTNDYADARSMISKCMSIIGSGSSSPLSFFSMA